VNPVRCILPCLTVGLFLCAGVRMSNHPNELIVTVLRAIEAREWPTTQVCRAYGLPHQTVKHWLVNGLPYYEKKLAAEKRLASVAANQAPLDRPKLPAELQAVQALLDPTASSTIEAKTTLHIPDLHAPFAHKDALPFLIEVHNSRRCCRVVCAGTPEGPPEPSKPPGIALR
jgi:hypothetical protein